MKKKERNHNGIDDVLNEQDFREQQGDEEVTKESAGNRNSAIRYLNKVVCNCDLLLKISKLLFDRFYWKYQ